MPDIIEITIRVDEGASEGAFVEQVGPRLFRLEDSPLLANRDEDPIHAGDVVEVEPQPDGSYLIVRVAQRSPMRHFNWAVPRVFVESPQYREFTSDVEAAGGAWQGLFGGLLWVHLPPESSFDAEAELSRRIALSTPKHKPATDSGAPSSPMNYLRAARISLILGYLTPTVVIGALWRTQTFGSRGEGLASACLGIVALMLLSALALGYLGLDADEAGGQKRAPWLRRLALVGLYGPPVSAALAIAWLVAFPRP